MVGTSAELSQNISEERAEDGITDTRASERLREVPGQSLAPGNENAGADQPRPACVRSLGAVERDELGNGPTAVGDDDLLATLGDVEIATELGFEPGDPDLGHMTIMVTSRRRVNRPMVRAITVDNEIHSAP
jgi:hypothetical protein